MFSSRSLYEQESREVLERIQSLKTALEAATTIASSLSNDSVKETLSEELQTIHNDVEGVRKYLSFIISPKFYNERRQKDSTIAERVLNIPKLFELITMKADLVTIVSMSQVSRTFKSNIEASSTLQVKIGFKAMDPSKLLANKCSVPVIHRFPFKFRVEHHRLRKELPAGSVKAKFELSRKTMQLPQIGTTWKRMLVCNPPVTEMMFI